MYILLCLLIGYGFGCIQTSYIIAKTIKKIDIRDYGSGNAGATNINRVLGFKFALLVFFCDILKAVIAFWICSIIPEIKDGTFNLLATEKVLGLYGGIGVLLGHNYPFYMKFKGGKGIASTLGIILFVDWRVALISYACGFIAVLFTKYISLASLIITGLFPILLILFNYKLDVVIASFIITGMAYYQHRSNIKRLLNGNENKFSFRRK